MCYYFDAFYWLDRELDEEYKKEKEKMEDLSNGKKRIDENRRSADVTNS